MPNSFAQGHRKYDTTKGKGSASKLGSFLSAPSSTATATLPSNAKPFKQTGFGYYGKAQKAKPLKGSGFVALKEVSEKISSLSSLATVFYNIALKQAENKPYEVLGLKQGASLKEVQCAARRFKRLYDPAFNPNNVSDSELKLAQVIIALNVLEGMLEDKTSILQDEFFDIDPFS